MCGEFSWVASRTRTRCLRCRLLHCWVSQSKIGKLDCMSRYLITHNDDWLSYILMVKPLFCLLSFAVTHIQWKHICSTVWLASEWEFWSWSLIYHRGISWLFPISSGEFCNAGMNIRQMPITAISCQRRQFLTRFRMTDCPVWRMEDIRLIVIWFCLIGHILTVIICKCLFFLSYMKTVTSFSRKSRDAALRDPWNYVSANLFFFIQFGCISIQVSVSPSAICPV